MEQQDSQKNENLQTTVSEQQQNNNFQQNCPVSTVKDDSIAIFVLGIISFIFGIIFGTALPALVLGIIATVKGSKTVKLDVPDIRFAKIGYGLGLAGLITGAVRLVIGIICYARFAPILRSFLYYYWY